MQVVLSPFYGENLKNTGNWQLVAILDGYDFVIGFRLASFSLFYHPCRIKSLLLFSFGVKFQVGVEHE